jgi:hypothetical protein
MAENPASAKEGLYSSQKKFIIMKKLQIGMSKLIGSFLVAGLTVLSLSAFGQSKEKTMTVKGEVLDMSCYMAEGAHGAGHKMCAQRCLKKGLPAGLLTSDGKVYLLVEDHDKTDAYNTVIKHAADQMTITGKYADKNGVQALVVENAKASSGS